MGSGPTADNIALQKANKKRKKERMKTIGVVIAEAISIFIVVFAGIQITKLSQKADARAEWRVIKDIPRYRENSTSPTFE